MFDRVPSLVTWHVWSRGMFGPMRPWLDKLDSVKDVFILYTLCFLLYTLCFMLYTVYFMLCALYCILYTLCFLLYTLYFMLYTLYFMLYTFCFILYTLYFILILYTLYRPRINKLDSVKDVEQRGGRHFTRVARVAPGELAGFLIVLDRHQLFTGQSPRWLRRAAHRRPHERMC